MVILNKSFIILNIQDYETKESDKSTKYRKLTCRDVNAPAFCNDFYYIFDFTKNYNWLEKGKTYKFELYLNSKKGNLFLVLRNAVEE